MKMKNLGLILAIVIAAGLLACGPDIPAETLTADPQDSEAPLGDLDALLSDAPDQSKLGDEPKADGVMPAKFDLVEFQSPVRSQGRRGVCSIFSTVALMEHLYIKEGTLNEPDFSEQFLQWSAKTELGAFTHTEGSSGSRNLETIRRFGIVDEVALPFQSSRWTEADDERCAKDNEDKPVECFTNGSPAEEIISNSKRWHLPRSRFVSSSPKNIKAAMLQSKVAVIAGMTFFYQSWNHRKSKLPTNSDYWSEGYVLSPNAEDRKVSLEKRAGHSILLVGWDDTLEVPKVDEEGEVVLDADGNPEMEKGFFVFKNSWGTSGFGIRNPFGAGYGYLAYSYIEEFANVVTSEVPALDLEAEICDDGSDNNDDRRADCADPQCAEHPSCRTDSDGLRFEGESGLTIPDGGTMTTNIEVTEPGFVSGGAVALQIDHPFSFEVEVALTSPDGRRMVVQSPADSQAGENSDGIRGTFALDPFIGAASEGVWVLEVTDLSAPDQGVLESWNLTLKVSVDPPVEDCSDETDNVGNGLIDCFDPLCSEAPECAPAEPRTITLTSEPGATIPDNDGLGISDEVLCQEEGQVLTAAVTVAVTHPFRGDLKLGLEHGDRSVVLVDSEGGSAADIRARFEVPDFEGSIARGAWKLVAADNAELDEGTLDSWTLELVVQ